jgi:hypothetical protein
MLDFGGLTSAFLFKPVSDPFLLGIRMLSENEVA